MRIALYARYSTDKQAESSLSDQYRLCESRAPDGTIVARHGDDGVSGSTPVDRRPSGRALLADALAGRFDVLLVESLDRLSRDQVELERTVRRLEHRGIRIIGVSDGYDSAAAGRKVIRAVRGIVAELYLDDLRAKTHRGLTGKFQRGYIASGKCYGYQIVREDAGSRYEVFEPQAQWVRHIFEEFGAGVGISRLAYSLNRAGAASPRGSTWAVSALYGSPVKGAGILNNPLYVGRYIWNRSQWIKDPDTGRRQRIDRPVSEWLTADVPHLRIVTDEQWQRVRARIDAGRDKNGYKRQHRPPRTLFGGLLRCPSCGAPMVAINASQYGCSHAKDRGPAVCQGFAISRLQVERRLLSVVQRDLLSPAAAREFDAACEALRGAGQQAQQHARRRAEELGREIDRLVAAIAAAGHSDALLLRLQAIEAERTAQLEAASARPAPRIDAQRAFAALRLDLLAVLQRDRERARAMLAELIGSVVLERRGEEIWGRMDAGRVEQIATGTSGTVVAGARNERSRWVRIRQAYRPRSPG